MSEMTIDFFSAAFAKTETGQQEIQKRSLGLSPLVRRVLVLVDGQRSGKDLATFAGGGDIDAILGELVQKGCIEAKPREKPEKAEKPAAQAAPEAQVPAFLSRLPASEDRSAEQNEMARNFMINTVNSIFGQHTRISLIENIARAQGTEGLRKVYLQWESAMAENRIGAKRLPELQDKLVNVL
jgi:hypothetical protein